MLPRFCNEYIKLFENYHMECVICFEKVQKDQGFHCSTCTDGHVCDHCVERLFHYNKRLQCPLCRVIEIEMETPVILYDDDDDDEPPPYCYSCTIHLPHCLCALIGTIAFGMLSTAAFNLYQGNLFLDIVSILGFGIVIMFVLHCAILFSTDEDGGYVCMPYGCCIIHEE